MFWVKCSSISSTEYDQLPSVPKVQKLFSITRGHHHDILRRINLENNRIDSKKIIKDPAINTFLFLTMSLVCISAPKVALK